VKKILISFLLFTSVAFSQLPCEKYHVYRGDLSNSFLKFEKEKKGRVAFLGGSITYNPGWRDKVCDYLQERFPDTEFDFVAAGIPSTGSTPGAFRLTRDVFADGPVDLLFEEAAVNDATNFRTPIDQVRGMEGIVRHAHKLNPNIDIVLFYFVDPDKMRDYNNGQMPEVIQSHENVAEYYNLSAVNLALEVTERINAKEFTWAGDFKNLHPSPFGQEVYFNSMKVLLDKLLQPVEGKKTIQPHKLPQNQLDKFSYTSGHFVELEKAEIISGWNLDPKWEAKPGAGTREGFVNVPALVAEEPGAKLKLKFTGTAVGMFVAAGPDAGILEYQIDDGPVKAVDQFTKWSGSLHLPWLFILDDELSNSEHTLVLKTTDKKYEQSKGYACRIIHFAVNGK
jgi:sialidase-1